MAGYSPSLSLQFGLACDNISIYLSVFTSRGITSGVSYRKKARYSPNALFSTTTRRRSFAITRISLLSLSGVTCACEISANHPPSARFPSVNPLWDPALFCHQLAGLSNSSILVLWPMIVGGKQSSFTPGWVSQYLSNVDFVDARLFGQEN